MADKSMYHVNHPKDERFDEIHIYCVERWKESELSGDEWRFNYVAEVKRKGETVMQISSSKMHWLLEGLQWRITTAGEENKWDSDAFNRTIGLCDQPGCKEPSTVAYLRKERFTREGEKIDRSDYGDIKEFRVFCEKHKNRGDCGRDDAMHNYELIEVPNG